MILPTINETRFLIRGAHAGQTDLSGRPYHQHPERVCDILCERFNGGGEVPEYAQHAALLHDVLEDTRLTATDLVRFGYQVKTIVLVQRLTRTDPKAYQSYLSYIEHIAAQGCEWLIRIKLADLTHNSDPERWDALTDDIMPLDRRLLMLERYEKAKRILEPLA